MHIPPYVAPQQASIKAARALAERAHGLLADRLMRKDMEAVVERFAKLDASPAEPLDKEEIEVGACNQGVPICLHVARSVGGLSGGVGTPCSPSSAVLKVGPALM